MKPTRRGLIQLILFVASISVLMSFQNCGVQRPMVENLDFASVGFSHTGLETSCSTCHYADRPNSTAGFLNLNPNAPFDYDTHAGGMDCIECHKVTNAQRTRADWAGGKFTHDATLVSCEDCHTSQRPATYGNNSPHPATGDCAVCHSASMSTSFSSMADWQGGDNGGTGIAFDPTRDLSLPSFVPVWSATSITSLTPQTLTLHMVMNHSSKQISTANLANCNLCHANAGSGVYTGGRMHASLTAAGIAQPANCNDCHNSALPTGFVGPNDTKRTPQGPSMKHNAVAWNKNAAGTWAASTSKVILNDCSVCHKQGVGQSWGSSTYHASLIAGGIGQPSSCLDCHANSRPTVAMKNPTALTAFTHSKDPTGLGDCVACHTSQTTWAGSKFHASIANFTARCFDCHSGTVDNTKGFDHSTVNFTTQDCSACHTLNRTAPTWAGASGAVPAKITLLPPTGSGRAALTLNHPAMGTNVTCASCHTGTNYKKITGFDHSMMPTGTVCVYCHQSGQQNVAAGLTIQTRSNGHEGSNLNTQDCNTCHKSNIYRLPTKSAGTPARWSGGSWGSP